jgi:hypothetical protein
MATEIQGIDDIFEVWELDAPETRYRLVCEIDNSAEMDNEVSETDTKCGTFTGVKEMKGNFSGNAVSNATPTSSEASYERVISWQKEKTLLGFANYNSAFGAVAESAAYHLEGQGRFTNSNKTSTTGEVIQFSWTLTPSGEIELTPQS